MIAYQILDHLPRIPEDLLQRALDQLNFEDFDRALKNNYLRPQYRGLIKYIKNGQEHVAKRILKAPVIPELEQWITDNITWNYLKIEWGKTMEDDTSWGDCHPPHTDRNRNYTLVYNVWPGGPDHYTAYYLPKDRSIKVDYCMCFDNYDELDEIARFQAPLHTWTLLNAQMIHSIECVPDTRLSIQVGMSSNPFASLARESEKIPASVLA